MVETTGDAQVEALIQSRFDAWVETWPGQATRFGLHQHDGRLPDLSRAAIEADIAAERDFVRQLEAVEPAILGEGVAFERELALHSARLRLFAAEVGRRWERTSEATDEIGTALFLLLAREFAPLEERLLSLIARIEGIPVALRQVRDRLGPEPVRLWLEQEQSSAVEMPTLIGAIVAEAATVWPDGRPELARLHVAAARAERAFAEYAGWIEEHLTVAGDGTALGASELDHLVELRELERLTTDEILAIGYEQLEAQHQVRRAAGRAIDASLSESEVVERVKAEGPADFETALAAYRDSMMRARAYIARHELATLPQGDVLQVLPTPRHLRRVLPLAAYFEPAAFDRPLRGTYVVTPAVDDDPDAMREHNWASIVNTSVHEAYPGHHLQLSAALATPTPARLMTAATEFIEGWAMYCEQMMLEQGFEDSPERRVVVATDAIWRAARIILDIQLHRDEVGVDEAVDFLVEHAGFGRPVARAEVQRYTTDPGYNLSYLLGKVLLLRLRADEQARLGESFSLKRFHDALLYSGSLPVSYHRRLLAGEGGGPAAPVTLDA